MTDTAAPPRIVVGYDGSNGAASAVEWAACEAQQRGASLRIVTGFAVAPEVEYYGLTSRPNSALSALAIVVSDRHPDVDVELVPTHLDPRDALIVEAAEAQLLVVGPSESSPRKSLLLGSVTRTATRRSPCPAIVVRGDRSWPMARIVVGTDGSEESNAALDWACDEAKLHGAELVVVHAWAGDVMRADARDILDKAVGRCKTRASVDAHSRLVDGGAIGALAHASRDADLIVVGSRGRSGLPTMFFGSVALAMIEQSSCPVAVTNPRSIRIEED